ncbi:hypothetical protein GCM10007385_14850 [Tateyamaria omphalii]|nr:hypothetical protein GCM10007385_14850 [Tateyamaria omphalii]
MVSQSGGSAARVRIRPVGQKRLRGILIEAAWQWTSRASEAKDLYNRHFAKHGIGQKAIIAVARKLAIKFWQLAVDTQPAPMGDAARGARSA